MWLKSAIRRLALPLVVIFVLSLISPSQASAELNLKEGSDSAAILFDPLKVSNISLRMSSSDFESLTYPNVDWNREGDWRRTTMSIVVAGKNYGPFTVGVHLKGAWGSWRDVTGKAAFKIKMNAFVKGQTLFGQTKLTLNNMVQDRSYIHEFMTYKLMRAAGLPAPRTGYANVSLNGNNYGLHLNVETIDKRMLARWNISSETIYKGSLPNFPDFYPGNEWSYSLESGTEGSREELAAFLAINDYSGETWWEAISQATDMELVTKQWAVELYASHWDGYILNRNNYFINFDENGQVLLLSWGVDQTWGGAPEYFSFPTLLPNKCLESDSCREMYLQSLAKVSAVAQQLNLGYSAQAVANAIAQDIQRDPWRSGDPWSAQRDAINLESYRKAELAQLVVPWDTSYKTLVVNKLRFSPKELVYLAPGTKKAAISLVPRQAFARSEKITESLQPGSNIISLSLTSADGDHVANYDFDFYVLTPRTSKVSVKFNSGSAYPSASGNSIYFALLNKLETAKNIELTVTRPSSVSAATANKRIDNIKAALKARGISKYKLSVERTDLKSNEYLISAKYQN